MTQLSKRPPDRFAEQMQAAALLRDQAGALRFAPPVIGAYNPLRYAWSLFEAYVRRYGAQKKSVLFLGMNPGPWGMAQTGIPFGEVGVVRHWLKLEGKIEKPENAHPKYPVKGLECARSEVSGKRLWGLFERKFGGAEHFFAEHFVLNYCPLLFIAASPLRNGGEGARNLTPDKLSAPERRALYAHCDAHLRSVAAALEPGVLVGIGNFAASRAQEALSGSGVRVCKILHPSPASPRSNTDWAGEAERQLITQGVW